jgi:hypothetical protein
MFGRFPAWLAWLIELSAVFRGSWGHRSASPVAPLGAGLQLGR